MADRASLLFPSLTRIATSMSKRGLITQTRDQSDRRRQIIEKTNKGQSIIDEHADRSLQIKEAYMQTLGEKDYEKLLSLLGRLDPGAKK